MRERWIPLNIGIVFSTLYPARLPHRGHGGALTVSSSLKNEGCEEIGGVVCIVDRS